MAPVSGLTNLALLEIETFPIPADFFYDDGTTESILGLNDGGDLCWIHRFETAPGGETIFNVQTVFGCMAYPGISPPNGTPCTIFVWDDPTDDGDPSDCVLVASEDSQAQNVDTDFMNTIELSVPVTVTGEFYVGCVMTHGPGQYVIPMDQSTPYVPGDAIFCGTITAGGFDAEDLMNNTYQPQEYGSYWCLRAGYFVQ